MLFNIISSPLDNFKGYSTYLYILMMKKNFYKFDKLSEVLYYVF